MKQVKEIKRHKLQAAKQISHEYELYSVGSIEIMQCLCMVTDNNKLYSSVTLIGIEILNHHVV